MRDRRDFGPAYLSLDVVFFVAVTLGGYQLVRLLCEVFRYGAD